MILSERKVIVMVNINAKLGCEEIVRGLRKFGVPGVNGNGECPVDVCADRGLFLANTLIEH